MGHLAIRRTVAPVRRRWRLAGSADPAARNSNVAAPSPHDRGADAKSLGGKDRKKGAGRNHHRLWRHHARRAGDEQDGGRDLGDGGRTRAIVGGFGFIGIGDGFGRA